MLKRLTELKLLRKVDSSYPGSRQTTWCPTSAGKALVGKNAVFWLDAVGIEL
jgi:hypothetical protein